MRIREQGREDGGHGQQQSEFFSSRTRLYYEEKRHHLSKRDKNALGSCPVSQETAWVHNQDWISTQPSCSDTKYPWHFSWHATLICDRTDSIYKQFMKANALFKTLAGGLAFQTAASTFWFTINYSSAKFWTYTMPIKNSTFYLENCIFCIFFCTLWQHICMKIKKILVFLFRYLSLHAKDSSEFKKSFSALCLSSEQMREEKRC